MARRPKTTPTDLGQFARFAPPRASDPLSYVVGLLRSRGYSDQEIREIATCRMLFDGPRWLDVWVMEMGWNPPPSKVPPPPPVWMGDGQRAVEGALRRA